MKKTLVALLLLTACRPVTPPKPPDPPPTVAVRIVQLTVWPGASPVAELVIDGAAQTHPEPWRAECATEFIDNTGSKVKCTLPSDAPAPFGAEIFLNAKGFEATSTGHFALSSFIDDPSVTTRVQELPGITLQPETVSLPRLGVRETHFTVNGQPFPIIGHTEFNILNRFIAGEDVEPIFNQRQAAGVNWMRVFTAYNVCPPGSGCQEIGRLVPREHTDFYSKAIKLAQKAAKHRIYIEYVGLTGPYEITFTNDVAAMIKHWESMIAVGCAQSNVNLELINEADQPANSLDGHLDLTRFRRPNCGVLASHGSNGSRATPVRPWWDWENYHTNGAPEWQRQTGHNCMEFTKGAEDIQASHVPCLADENTRYWDTESSPERARGAAVSGKLLSAGVTLHTVEGKNSTLWGSVTAAAMKATTDGVREIPDSCMDWTLYEHPVDLEQAGGWLRTYRVDGRNECVANVSN